MLRSAVVFTCLFCVLGFGLRACRAEPPSPIVLPNGLRVVLRERHTNTLVAIDLWIRAGAREERAGEVGCAHFLEHTLFKGTTTRDPGDIDIAAENLGAVLHAATGPDAAHFYTTTTSDHLGEALRILADVVRNATLPDAEVERERGVILDELAQHDADDEARLIDLLYAGAFPTHPYGRSPGGTVGAIGIRGRDSLAAFYHRTYRPDRCTLALAGDVTPERARAESLRAFGDWSDRPGNAAASFSLHSGAEPLLNSRQITQPAGAGGESRVGIAFRAPAASEQDMACAAVVTAALLGESDGTGRLAIPALDGTDAQERVTPRREASLFLLTAVLPPAAPSHSANQIAGDGIDSLSDLGTALFRAIADLLSNPPALAELNAAKRRVLGRAEFDAETDAGLARALGYADMVGGDMPEAFAERVRQLTLADVRRFVQTYLDPAHCLVVRLVPSAVKIGVAP